MSSSRESAPANPDYFPQGTATAVPIGGGDILNCVAGTIRWLKSYGVPELTEAERIHAHRSTAGTIHTVDLSVGVLISVCNPREVPGGPNGQFTNYMPTDGVAVSCWPGPVSQTHHQLQYRAQIRPESLGNAKAIKVELSEERAWIPDLGRRHRTFEPSINPVNMSTNYGPSSEPRASGPFGSALELNDNQSFAIVDFEMTVG